MTNFHSSGLKQKVDQLMNILFSGGVNNPMDSIEQISYLLFLRLLSEKDETLAGLDKKYKRIFSGTWAKRSWGNFVTLTGDELFDAVRAAMESLHELPDLSATGRLLFEQATLKIYDRPTLRAVIQAIHALDLKPHDGEDLKGDMYEYLLSQISMSGTNGQFRTPRHIINMIAEIVSPQPGERICDPACGTAGFLIAAFQHILRSNTSKADLAKGHVSGDRLKPADWKFLEERAFTGFDNDANMVKIAILNLYLHQLEKADIEFYNPLTTGKGGAYPGVAYDVILTNPPFAGSIQQESILSDLNHGLNTRDTELLFLKWFIDHLAIDGRAGVIVPNGVLFASTNAATKLRQMLLKECDLQAVISMPSGVFKPYSGVGTAILIFKKGKSTKSVWFYDLTADGFSLSDTRTPIDDNDIPDLLAKWSTHEQSKNSFSVPIRDIEIKNFELLPARYRQQRIETADHAHPDKIIEEVLALEEDIAKRAKQLKEKLQSQ
jgi:type I restriction enzyme M protein